MAWGLSKARAVTIGGMQALDVWHARLDGVDWPSAENLPAADRERAASIRRADARRRWAAARGALREILGRYLERDPAAIELRFGERGKPMLADSDALLRFNLSHSGELALIAIGEKREVGIDVQSIGSRPARFYADWTRREAIAKCHGSGLWAPLPETAVSVAEFDAGPGYAASVAIAGERMPPLRQFEAEPR
jgi:4'-phosphopantetheinyl transferase